MSSSPTIGARPATDSARLSAQLLAFVAIGVLGYLVDAAITYACARNLGLSAELARPPGFVVATITNFLLNRAITFRGSRAPVIHAFVRYCAVASAGLAVNYAIYSICVLLSPRFGVAVTPAILPAFIAAGSATAMIVTFLGFKVFAFR